MNRREMLKLSAGMLGGLVLAKPLLATQGAAAAGRDQTSGPSLIVYGDTVWAGATTPPDLAAVLSCTQANRFPQGTGITFRFLVLDPDTQQPVDPSQIQSMTVTLPDGTAIPFTYHPFNRGQSSQFAWFAMWPIPNDYPTGSLQVQIMAVDDQGRTGSWMQFDSPTSQLQIVAAGQR